MHPSGGTFIYLLGIPGCGKLTIAKAIQQRWPCILLDNHHVNNVILPLIDPDGRTPKAKQVWDKVRTVRSAVLETLREDAKPGRNFVFTNYFREGVHEHVTAFNDVCEVAAYRKALVVAARLSIHPEDAARRVSSPGRLEAFKEIDEDQARLNAQTAQILRPQNVPVLDLDVTMLAAADAAERIIAFARAEA